MVRHLDANDELEDVEIDRADRLEGLEQVLDVVLGEFRPESLRALENASIVGRILIVESSQCALNALSAS